MLNIDIIDDFFHIKNINEESLNNIYSIYRNTGDFKYATGVFNQIDYEPFSNQIFQFIQRKNVFFLDICLATSEQLIGFIKGSVLENGRMAWINSLIINTPYQSKGYGKKAIQLLENYLKKNYGVKNVYLSVSECNIPGINFWNKCGYRKCDYLSGHNTSKFIGYVQFMCKIL